MKPIPILVILISLIFISGCGTNYQTTKILNQDQAKIVITLNKGFSNTVIVANEGKRLEPVCIYDHKGKDETSPLPSCEELERQQKGRKVLFEQTIQIKVTKGSPLCIEKRVGNLKFVVCDPPDNLHGLL
jgi:hypothetical protein